MDFLDFVRKRAQEQKERFIQKHYGPGPHKGTGTPQSIHAGAKQRKGTPKGGAKAAPKRKLSTISTKALRTLVTKLQAEYGKARAENRWLDVGEIEQQLLAASEEEKLRHFAQQGWHPKGMKKREWAAWEKERGYS